MLPSNESFPWTYHYRATVAISLELLEESFCTSANDSVAMKSPDDKSQRWIWGKRLTLAHLRKTFDSWRNGRI